jgi:hypothetical protein
MENTTIKNHKDYRISKNKIVNKYTFSIKMNYLQAMLDNKFEKQVLGNQIHVLNWLDNEGYINIAFQILSSQPIKGINNVKYDFNTSSISLVFSQKSISNISVTILHTILKDSKMNTVEENLGSYDLNDLDNTFITSKFDQFINSITV